MPKNHSLLETYFLQTGPTSYLSLPPNNTIMLWIHLIHWLGQSSHNLTASVCTFSDIPRDAPYYFPVKPAVKISHHTPRSCFWELMVLVWFILHCFVFPMKWLKQIQIYFSSTDLSRLRVLLKLTPYRNISCLIVTWPHWLFPVSFILSACFSFVNVSTWVSYDYKSLWYPADSKEMFIKASLKPTVRNTLGFSLPQGISLQSFFRVLSLLTSLNKLLLKLSMYFDQILSLKRQELGDSQNASICICLHCLQKKLLRFPRKQDQITLILLKHIPYSHSLNEN